MKKKTIFAGITFAVALAAVAVPASAGSMKLVIGDGSSVTISPTGVESYTGSCVGGSCAGTVAILPGQVTWSGHIGTFSGTITGTSAVAGSLSQLDLLIAGLKTGATGDTIAISWTDVGFTLGATPAAMNIAGGGLGTQSFSSYVDNSNAAFGMGTLVNTITGGVATGPGPTASPFSMTDVATLTLPAGVGTTLPLDSIDFLFNDAPPVLALNCSSLAAGVVGTPYNASLVGSGGVTPYTYSITGGSISPLTLDMSTGAITGTPTVAGNLNFTAQVVDSSGTIGDNTVSSSCSIIVATVNTGCVIPPSGSAIPGDAVSWNKFNTSGNNNVVWVHAHIGTPTGVSKTSVTTVNYTGVTFVLNGITYALPDGVVTFDPSAPATPSTSFSPGSGPNGTWFTIVNPSHLSDQIFFDGGAIPVDANIKGGGKATINFTTQSNDTTLGFQWQWSAAVFTNWPVWGGVGNPNAGNNIAQIEPYHSSLDAGAPMNTTVQKSLIQGPRGGGGSNFSGSWSGTGNATCITK